VARFRAGPSRRRRQRSPPSAGCVRLICSAVNLDLAGNQRGGDQGDHLPGAGAVVAVAGVAPAAAAVPIEEKGTATPAAAATSTATLGTAPQRRRDQGEGQQPGADRPAPGAVPEDGQQQAAPRTRLKFEQTPCVKGALHVAQARSRAATSAALVHPSLVVGTPRSVPRHRWPGWTLASKGQPLGDPAPDDQGASHRPQAQRDHRLPRGWAESHRDGDERLVRRGAGLVAEPPSTSRHKGRSR
jgi:hypothetical protein